MENKIFNDKVKVIDCKDINNSGARLVFIELGNEEDFISLLKHGDLVHHNLDNDSYYYFDNNLCYIYDTDWEDDD